MFMTPPSSTSQQKQKRVGRGMKVVEERMDLMLEKLLQRPLKLRLSIVGGLITLGMMRFQLRRKYP